MSIYSCARYFVHGEQKQVFLTGVDQSGKSYLASELSKEFDMLRSRSFGIRNPESRLHYEEYQVFDRFSVLDTIGFQLKWRDYSFEESIKYLYSHKKALQKINEGVIFLFLTHDHPRKYDYAEYDYVRKGLYYLQLGLYLYKTHNIIFVINKQMYSLEEHLHTSFKEISIMKEEKFKELVKTIRRYYTGKSVGMTDEEYDILLKEAVSEGRIKDAFEVLKKYPDFESAPHSPEIRKHQPIDGKYKYSSKKDFLNWCTEEEFDEYYFTPKFDGCSIVAYYANGNLQNILTRSSEDTGIAKFEYLKNYLPKTLTGKNAKEVLAVCFEAVVEFRPGTSKYRNEANGLINSKYKEVEELKQLTFVPWDVYINPNSKLKGKLTYLERFEATGLTPPIVYESDKIKELIKAKSWEYKGKQFGIDGVVLYSRGKNEDFWIGKSYISEHKDTEVIDIEWNEGEDTHVYTPTLIYKPIILNSGKFQRVGIGQASTLISRKCGIGSIVRIKKSGGTIPSYVKTVKESENITVPNCWSCDVPTDLVGNGYICTNPECRDHSSLVLYNLLTYISQSKADEFWELFCEKYDDPQKILKKMNLAGDSSFKLENWFFTKMEELNYHFTWHDLLTICFIPHLSLSRISSPIMKSFKSIKGLREELEGTSMLNHFNLIYKVVQNVAKYDM